MTPKTRVKKFKKWLKEYTTKRDRKKYGYFALLIDFMCCTGDQEGLDELGIK